MDAQKEAAAWRRKCGRDDLMFGHPDAYADHGVNWVEDKRVRYSRIEHPLLSPAEKERLRRAMVDDYGRQVAVVRKGAVG